MKVEVWRRDRGQCNSTKNGASGTGDIEGKAATVAASECGKRASFKSDKILGIAPWVFAGGAVVPHIQKLSG